MESNPISFGLKLTLWFTNILTTLRMRQGIAIERQLFVNEKDDDDCDDKDFNDNYNNNNDDD